jgi:EAL domain-containing protein (putative c-di-GMP-specific phosphodiesterase class I)
LDEGASNEHDWFDSALVHDAFSFHFQPIVDLSRERVHAHECLIRLTTSDRTYGGGEIVQTAFARGRVHAFDSYCRQKAIREAALQAAPGTKVFINFLPSSIYDPAHCLQSTLDALRQTRLQPADVVFEVVESEEIRNLTHLLTIRDFYRDHGFGFALDDVGTGSNTLTMVKQFRPEYIKIDKSLTSTSGANWREIEKLQEFANWWGAKIIAEGVEEIEQAEALRAAGIELMQGWLFGRPAPEMMKGLAVLPAQAPLAVA